MTHKVCPVCGSVAEVMMGIARCGNPDCFICDFGFHVEQWDAPRPLEEKMKADIEILRAEIDDLRDSLRNERIFSSKWLHERDAARAELESAKKRGDTLRALLDQKSAELEAYKARRCDTCGRILGPNSMWCAEWREYMRPEQFCSEWEPQPAPGGEEGKE